MWILGFPHKIGNNIHFERKVDYDKNTGSEEDK